MIYHAGYQGNGYAKQRNQDKPKANIIDVLSCERWFRRHEFSIRLCLFQLNRFGVAVVKITT